MDSIVSMRSNVLSIADNNLILFNNNDDFRHRANKVVIGKARKDHKYSVHKSIYFDLPELTNTMAAYFIDRTNDAKRETSPKYVYDPLQKCSMMKIDEANA